MRLDMDSRCFGALVYRLRQERRWTLVHLAKLTGMNATYLGIVERGENVPTLTTILRVAEALGVAASDLVREVEQARTAARVKRVAQ
jgi:transcriptional regulator with XRE-family HTH domain